MKTAIVIPDLHVPFHNKKALNSLFGLIKVLKPSEIVFLGDFLDFYSISRFSKDPMLPNQIKQEVLESNKILDKIEELSPKSKRIFIEGNHEFRFQKFLQEKAPELYGLISCRALLGFNKRKGWSWVDYGPNQAYRVCGFDLIARHEPLGPNMRASSQRSMVSHVCGHTHRIDISASRSLNGNEYFGYNLGWLGDSKAYPSVFSYLRGHEQWNLGFGVCHFWRSNFQLEVVRVQEGSFIFKGEVFK